jgi:putative membrane protein
MKNYFLIALAVAALCLGACKKKESYENTASTSTSATDTSTYGTAGTATTATTATTAATLSKDDQEFATKAAQGNMAEVNAGQMAAQKGTSPDVKAFGNRMVNDHGKALDELKQWAATKGFTLPTDVSDSQKSEADKLSKKSGADFDKTYADTMADDHEKDAKEFEKASKDAQDPDLKAWAAKTLPVIQDHLKMAKEMKGKVKGEKNPKAVSG